MNYAFISSKERDCQSSLRLRPPQKILETKTGDEEYPYLLSKFGQNRSVSTI